MMSTYTRIVLCEYAHDQRCHRAWQSDNLYLIIGAIVDIDIITFGLN